MKIKKNSKRIVKKRDRHLHLISYRNRHSHMYSKSDYVDYIGNVDLNYPDEQNDW